MKVSVGTVHPLPKDLKGALLGKPKALATWEATTPLARNEWICWVTSGKEVETRGIRIDKAISKLKGGMKRPCCWAGCMHRTDKPLSPSQKFVQNKTNGKK